MMENVGVCWRTVVFMIMFGEEVIIFDKHYSCLMCLLRKIMFIRECLMVFDSECFCLTVNSVMFLLFVLEMCWGVLV